MYKTKKLIEQRDIARHDGVIYLRRWYLFFNCFKLHHFLEDDNECQHDHPWAFISIILRGKYREHTPLGSKVYSAGSILFRRAMFIHRITIEKKPCWSFVISFRIVRKWGFWTKRGWVHWKRYNATGGCDL